MPLWLASVSYCSVGQNKSHDQAQNQCDKGQPEGRLAKYGGKQYSDHIAHRSTLPNCYLGYILVPSLLEK